ncbi:dihydrodipicolinate synthase family protein [Sphingobium sp.]|uniref:dihydrodipicolinate synthase family protein n=1 Tax=Sphingobium sp. TaxID=1912891 RepID=UPI002E1CFFC6
MDYDRKDAKKWATETVRGFYQCPITPMTADHKFDIDGIRYNIDKYVEMGLDGLVVGGFIAECWNVTPSEWMRYHEIVAEANAGRLDLWTIILDPSVHLALEKMQFVEKLGFNGAEVINPVVQLRTDDEIFAWFKYLTDRSNMAVCLYRTPVSGTVLSWNLMRRLADLETVIGVKQGALNRAETIKIRSLMPEGFNTMEPFEYFFLEDLRLGGTVCWGELSFMLYGKKRHLARDYINLANQGKWEEARTKWEGLHDVREYYHDQFVWDIARTATYASALANIKAWYEAIGLKAGPILPPVADVTPQKKEEIRAKLIELGIA